MDSETRQTLTYAQIIDDTKALAAALQLKCNLNKGDRVAIALPLCVNYPIVTMAVQLIGATVVLINPGQTICIFL